MLNDNEVAVEICYECGNKIAIPETVNYKGRTYAVTSIRQLAFWQNCPDSLVIPKTVTQIGERAFYNRANLKVITFYNSHITIDEDAFLMNNYSRPEREICISLADTTDFKKYLERNDLVYYYIGYISRSKHSLFINGQELVGNITIPENTNFIGNYAFANCNNLTSIYVSDNVQSIGYHAFDNCQAKICANSGSYAMLALWKYGIDPYESPTSSRVYPRPYLSAFPLTQTTAKIRINNKYSFFSYVYDDESLNSDEINLNGLDPEYNGSVSVSVRKSVEDKSVTFEMNGGVTTKPISPTIQQGTVTATSLTASGSYTEGDAEVDKQFLSIGGYIYKEGTSIDTIGLDPGRTYRVYYRVQLKNGKTYDKYKDISTASLTLTSEEPKVINEGNAIVCATSNLNDNETNVGFEWRRTDWTDDMKSNSHVAYLYDGTIEGYIRNLNKEHFWKVRPYYQANSGNYYYGDWKTFDPTNTSYFEPTVHTYASVSVNGNNATVKGYAQRGTDNITSQGFMYWKSRSSSAKSFAPSNIPTNATKVEVSGTIMETTLSELDYNSTYTYIAYVTTSEGETFYGDECSFETGSDPTGIVAIKNNSASNKYPSGIYDMSGCKYDKLHKGINIIRYEDGTVKKVIIK